MTNAKLTSPSKEQLSEAYHQLYKKHPHHLLRLETELPVELRPESRDTYRTIMTMILSQRTDDYSLSMSLGKLFSAYPAMDSWINLGSRKEVETILNNCCFPVDGPAEYNVDRLWCLVRLFFDKWNKKIKLENIEALQSERGYAPDIMRQLYAYWLGKQKFLPLDGKACAVLKENGLYDQDTNINEIRADLEEKLGKETSISLIDFHEMLRFQGQTDGKSIQSIKMRKTIIGWNAWRLLCSSHRAGITGTWIYEHLVKDKNMAEELWNFYRQITNTSIAL